MRAVRRSESFQVTGMSLILLTSYIVIESFAVMFTELAFSKRIVEALNTLLEVEEKIEVTRNVRFNRKATAAARSCMKFGVSCVGKLRIN